MILGVILRFSLGFRWGARLTVILGVNPKVTCQGCGIGALRRGFRRAMREATTRTLPHAARRALNCRFGRGPEQGWRRAFWRAFRGALRGASRVSARVLRSPLFPPASELAPRAGDAILVPHQERLVAFGRAAGTATELEGATVPGPCGRERGLGPRVWGRNSVPDPQPLVPSSAWSDAAREAKGPSSPRAA